MAQACIVYLMQPSFASGHCDWNQLKTRLEQWPLYYYAAHYWPFHVEASIELDEETWGLIQQFFNTRKSHKGGNYAAWAGSLTPDIDEPSLRHTQPLYYAASFGITSLIKKLLATDPGLNVNALGGRFDSPPVQVAVYRNHPAAVKLLLDANANPMIPNSQGESCWLWAYLRRHTEVQKILSEYGVKRTKADDAALRDRYDKFEPSTSDDSSPDEDYYVVHGYGGTLEEIQKAWQH